MARYDPDGIIKIIDTERGVPTDSRGRLYEGYQALIRYSGKRYKEFRDTVGPKPRSGSDTRAYSPSEVIRHAIEHSFIESIEDFESSSVSRIEPNQFWWVNQNQTYKHEVRGGYLWSPKTNANGIRNPFYDNMEKMEPGDVVFSFCDTRIRAIGVVMGTAETASKPTEFGEKGVYWSAEGWFVPVEFEELENTIRPKEHISQIRPTLPKKYSPLQSNGNGNQGVYLAQVSKNLAAVLIDLLGGQVEKVTKHFGAALDEADEEEVEQNIKERSDIEETEKVQLIKARRGQGLFRSRVELVEKACRLTGVNRKEHLRASHIKPWAKSENHEKLDGNNGLLLAPHVDHLFDRGFISFSDDGTLLIASKLDPEVLRRWGLEVEVEAQSFNPGQRQYMAYHRDNIFGGTDP